MILTMNILFILLLCTSVNISLGVVREFYIASEEIVWNYHRAENLEIRSELSFYRRSLISKDGSQGYIKAIYREYTDATFSTFKAKSLSTGLQGPTIRAEVSDKVVVHFKNFASQPYSMYPIGISFWKQSEGAGYDDATSAQEKGDDAVVPGGYYRYVWDILPANGPTVTDPDCLTYSYSSQVDIVRDFNSGLIGAFLICKAGSLTSDGHQKVPEYILLFAVFDEARSWYGGLEVTSRQQKLYHTINGYVNSSLPGLKMCQKTSIFWHLIGMGSSSDIHSIYFQKHTMQVMNHRKVFLEMTPMTFITAEMKPVGVGNYLISCQIHSHQLAGMNAQFTIEDCPESAKSSVKDNAIQIDDYEYDISLEGMVSPILVNSKLHPRSAVKLKPKTWVHYIAAEEIVWDYAPELSKTARTSDYTARGPRRIGKVYKKATYVEYMDASFKQRKTSAIDLVGPVLRGEVDDKIKIFFKNLASVPFNIYPSGLTSISPFESQAKVQDLRNHPVMPNETFVYVWRITPEDGPTKADPRCLTRLYQSTVNPVQDLASGLVGPIVVCYRKTLDKRGNVLMSDKEKHLMFTVFDENKSWYIDENIKKYIEDPSKVNRTDADFYRSNVMYNVNGLMYNNLKFAACLGDVTFWHVLNVGTQSDFLSVYFMGNTFERDKVYETVLTLFPMNGETISMEMETLGEWDIGAFDSNLKKRGMSARYTVTDCHRNLPLLEDSDYLEDYIERNIARSAGRKNRTLAVRMCKRPISKSTSNVHEVCEIMHVSLSPDDMNEADGDIPEDILLEVEKQKQVVSLQNRTQNHLPLDLAKSDTNNTFTAMNQFQQKNKKRSVPSPIPGGGLTGVPRTTPSNYEEIPNAENNTKSPILDTTPPVLNEEDIEHINEDYRSTEELNIDTHYNKQLNWSFDHAQPKKNHTISLRSVKDPKPQNRQKGNGQLRPERGGKRTASNRKVTKSQQKEELEKKNLIPEQENLNKEDIIQQISENFKDASSMADIQASISNGSSSDWRDAFLEYDDYTNEDNQTEETSDSLNLRTTDGKYRSYYIAAVEVMWDYGIEKKQQFIKSKEMLKGRRKYLPEYKKVVFRAYIDQDFMYPATRGELEEHLGILGPVIKTEINDQLTVTFKNLASKPFSFHLHGIFDQNQGEEYGEGSGEAVQPNEMRVYRWKITKRQGPSAKEFDCKAWTYYSNLNMERDINSGLVGPLVVCKPGTLHSITNIDVKVQEFHLLFTVFDETKSWYFDENINRFCLPPCNFKKNDPWFEYGNKFAGINGYIAETLPGLLVAQHRQVRWHLLNMGGSGEFHAVHFHGLPFTVRSDQEHRMGIYSLYPGVFGTVEMRPAMTGTWMVECSIGEHQLSGMRAKLLVYSPECVEPIGMRTGRITDSQITDSGHYGNWEARLARLELSGSVNAWSGQDKTSWIQVDLQRPMLLHRIRTQGAKHGLSESFIVTFNISYSLDNTHWKTYKGNSSKPAMTFTGNMDGSHIKENFFSPPILGRYIKIHPIVFSIRPTLRLELYGCDLNSCSVPLGMEKMLIPSQSISASSFLHKLFLSWSPSLARLNLEGTANAWRPKANNPYEWIQVDFTQVKQVTGVVTQGARSFLTHMMVTEFTVSISNNGQVWTSVLEEDTNTEKVFQGNDKYDEETLNIFEPPLFTRYIRIHPKGWYNEIALRLEFLGCDTQQ